MLTARNKHLLWRAGFGPSLQDREQLAHRKASYIWKRLVESSKRSHAPIDVLDDPYREMLQKVEAEGRLTRTLTNEERRQMQVRSREGIRRLNLQWIDRMTNDEQQLREKLAFFWHGHFASRTINLLYQQQLLDIIRNHALGNFRTLLKEVSRSASMIFFLNNNKNVKNHPNENFARELMELFTLGRGNYSETDIRESARAFTGWNTNLKGEFVFRKLQHDSGVKHFLGKTGNFSGEDIIDIILERKDTARFITSKLFRFFVNEQADPEQIEWLANRFYNSGYEIMELLNDIFTSDWFFDEANIGNRIKSPVELIVGIRRMLPMQPLNEDSTIMIQRLLGQILFYPPNVAGWPGGRNWIDSSSLMFRMKLPAMLAARDLDPIRLKDDDDIMMGIRVQKQQKNVFNAQIQWQDYVQAFAKTERKDLVTDLSTFLLMHHGSDLQDLITRFADPFSREQYIQSVTLDLMSLPEFQLC